LGLFARFVGGVTVVQTPEMAPLLATALVLALTTAPPVTAAFAARRRVYGELYRPEDSPQFHRNVFHPPRSDSPSLPNFTIFTGPRGANAGDLAQLERQLGCYGDGPCPNTTAPDGFGLADAVMGGGCEGAVNQANCAAAFAKYDWWTTGGGPQQAGSSHANLTPPVEVHKAMGERWLGVGLGEWDGGYVWQQQQDDFPTVSSGDQVFARHLSFYSFMERFVESNGANTSGLCLIRIQYFAQRFDV
jgi:hypothetical protein